MSKVPKYDYNYCLTHLIPPPKSNTNIFDLPNLYFFMYASIAAVGSCSKSFNFNPAISAAFFVAAICLSLKEVGTVTIAFVTFFFVYFLKERKPIYKILYHFMNFLKAVKNWRAYFKVEMIERIYIPLNNIKEI